MVIEILLIVVVFLLLFLIYLVYKSGEVEPRDLENAISGVLEESGLSVEVGELATYARDMRDT